MLNYLVVILVFLFLSYMADVSWKPQQPISYPVLLSLYILFTPYIIIMSKKDWIPVASKMNRNKLKQNLIGSRQICWPLEV